MRGGLLQQSMLGEGGESGLAGQQNSLPHLPMGGHQREWRSCSHGSLSISLLTLCPSITVRVSFELEGKVQEVPGQAFSHLAQTTERSVRRWGGGFSSVTFTHEHFSDTHT